MKNPASHPALRDLIQRHASAVAAAIIDEDGLASGQPEFQDAAKFPAHHSDVLSLVKERNYHGETGFAGHV